MCSFSTFECIDFCSKTDDFSDIYYISKYIIYIGWLYCYTHGRVITFSSGLVNLLFAFVFT